MAYLVGVLSPKDLEYVARTPGLLQRELLLWDRIAVPFLEPLVERLRDIAERSHDAVVHDVLWLYETGIIVDAALGVADLAVDDRALGQSLDELVRELSAGFSNVDLASRTAVKNPSLPLFNWEQVLLRGAAATAHLILEGDALPIVRSVRGPTRAIDGGRLAEVAAVLIRRLPIPEDKSYEDILVFKEGSERYLLALRSWIASAARSERSAPEIENDLLAGLAKYTEHRKLNRWKYRNAVARKVLPQVIESCLRLRISKAFDALNAAQQARIDLYEKNLTAPGREVAYVYQASKAFGQPRRRRFRWFA
jgi:hypothetical protein